jgi:hypothetical protein
LAAKLLMNKATACLIVAQALEENWLRADVE